MSGSSLLSQWIGSATTLLTRGAVDVALRNLNWLKSVDNAGTGYVEMFRANASDEIEVGAALNIGSIEFTEDAGAVTAMDMSVSSTPGDGTEESYALRLDGNTLLKIRGEADGSGAVDNLRVETVAVHSNIVEDTDSDTDDVLSTELGASYGMLIVRESTGGKTAVFRIENETIALISSDGATWSVSKDNGSTYNVYWDTDQYKIQNKVGDDKNIRAGFFGV